MYIRICSMSILNLVASQRKCRKKHTKTLKAEKNPKQSKEDKSGVGSKNGAIEGPNPPCQL